MKWTFVQTNQSAFSLFKNRWHFPGVHFPIFREECCSTAICLKQQGDHDIMVENMLSRSRAKTRGINSSLCSPPGPLSFLLVLTLTPAPNLPSAPPHTLFMSAWIAPFHPTQLPAHYQPHNCFNPPPTFSFYYHDNTQWGVQEGEEKSGGTRKRWTRGRERGALTSASIFKKGDDHRSTGLLWPTRAQNQQQTASQTKKKKRSLLYSEQRSSKRLL